MKNERIEKEFSVELEVTVEAMWTPGQKEHITGLPENCFPAESGEIDQVRIFIGDRDITNKLNEEEYDYLLLEMTDYCEECVG